MDISPASLFAILAILLYLPLLILYRKTKLYKPVNLPPGRMGWPIIGESSDFALSCKKGALDKFMFDRMRRYAPDVFKTSLLGEKTAVFCGPAGNKFVFSNENKLVKSWVPDSVAKTLLPDRDDWEHAERTKNKIRAVATEFLKPDAIQEYLQTVDSVVRQHLDQEWAPNQIVTVYPLAKKLLFSLSCRIFMGIEDKNQMKKLEDQFELVAGGLFAMPIDLPGTKLRRAIRAADVMRDELHKIIRQEKLSKNKDSGSRFNLLTYLLSATDDEGKLLNDKEIVHTIMSVLLGSQHTTSSLVTNLVYFLADHPVVYDRALREQLEIRKSKGEEKELLSWEDVKRMKYGRSVLNEVLRLAPAGIGFFRMAIHDINFGGYTIPKGWKIFWSMNTTHKDPEYFPDPEKFDPTRFEGNGLVPFTFTPFGGGPRMCPGNEFARYVSLVFMHNLLINFKWDKLNPTEKIINVDGVAAPENGLSIKLQSCRREQETDDS